MYMIQPQTAARVNRKMNNRTVKTLWNRFCFGAGELQTTPCDEMLFCVGGVAVPPLPAGCAYALRVNENGVALVGRDFTALMNGFAALLMKIELDDHGRPVVQSVEESRRYAVENRMIHFCVFPENSLVYMKKLVRLAALCQYTHVVLEFWGMLSYDCLKELAWPCAFTKAQVAELIAECHDLGLEPIPMFNQLGHASGSRIGYGKHTVLDQNPSLQRLFTPDGWAWNIESPEVHALHRQVRQELYELFGPGNYMHLGCDEAYYITRNARLRAQLPDYLARLTAEVEQEGRRPMIWMDMLLNEGAFADCYATGKPEETARLRRATAPSTVFVDWQYDCLTAPIPSLASLRDCGHDCMGAPWFKPANYRAHIQTVRENGLFGVMMTTWQLLKDHMVCVLGCAKAFGAASFVWDEYSGLMEETATLLRRVSFEGNGYAESGWSTQQILT